MNNEDIAYIKKHITKGNKKLPKSTWIFNSGSASDCPARKMGLCQIGEKCYALKAERQYPPCLPFRERQRTITETFTAEQFAEAFIILAKKVRKLPTLRFNESGDFYTQEQCDWFATVCEILKNAGIESYGYTARTDLNLVPLINASKVNVSNDRNGWVTKGANRFKVFTKTDTPPDLVCAGDCRICRMCLSTGKTIGVLLH